MFDHMKKTKVIAALTAGVGVACDAYGSANADTAKLAQLQQQLASVNASATFARIPAGTFQMGSPSSESGRYDNEILHSVTISHGFEMEHPASVVPGDGLQPVPFQIAAVLPKR